MQHVILIILQRNPETQQLPSIVESFKTYHTTKKGEWVNEVAEQDYVSYIFVFYIILKFVYVLNYAYFNIACTFLGKTDAGARGADAGGCFFRCRSGRARSDTTRAW